MQQTIAAAWVGLLIVLCLDMLITPYRWMWSAAAMVGVTFIGGWLFNAAEEFSQGKRRRK